jgi:hypothetical protein
MLLTYILSGVAVELISVNWRRMLPPKALQRWPVRISFSPTPEDTRLAISKLAAPDRFAQLARDFFARLTYRHLDYYLSRELSNFVGPAHRIKSADAHAAFNAALEQHCREVSRIVESFAGGWFSKTTFNGGITPEKAGHFIFVALRKIGEELRRRRGPHG